MGDREDILRDWITAESETVGRDLVEGEDFEVEHLENKIMLTYHTDPSIPGTQVYEITDTPPIH